MRAENISHMATRALEHNLLHNKSFRGRIIPFLPVTGLTRWDYVAGCMPTTLRYGHNVVLGQPIGLLSAVSTAIIIGFLYLLPLFLGKSVWNIVLPGSSGFFGSPINRFSMLCVFCLLVIPPGISAPPIHLLFASSQFLFSSFFKFLQRRKSRPLSLCRLAHNFPAPLYVVFNPLISGVNKMFSVGLVVHGFVALTAHTAMRTIIFSVAFWTSKAISSFYALVMPSVVTFYTQAATEFIALFFTLRAVGVFHKLIIVQGIENG